MTTKPVEHLDWLTGNLDPNSTEPPGILKEAGWAPGESPYSDHFNYMFKNIDDWAKVFAARDQFEHTVGSGPTDDFATLQACLASASVYSGDRILVRTTTTLAAVLNIDKSVHITFAQNHQVRGVLANAAIKININYPSVKIMGGLFQAFNLTVPIFTFGVGAENCSIEDISCSSPYIFDDSAVPAGFKPSIRGVRTNNIA